VESCALHLLLDNNIAPLRDVLFAVAYVYGQYAGELFYIVSSQRLQGVVGTSAASNNKIFNNIRHNRPPEAFVLTHPDEAAAVLYLSGELKWLKTCLPTESTVSKSK
jgi:hypothetical protein